MQSFILVLIATIATLLWTGYVFRLGVNGLRRGEIIFRHTLSAPLHYIPGWPVRRAEKPALFWFLIALHFLVAVIGVIIAALFLIYLVLN